MKNILITFVLLSLPLTGYAAQKTERQKQTEQALKKGHEALNQFKYVPPGLDLIPIPGEKNKREVALMHFQHAILLDPKSANAWFSTGFAEARGNNYDDALRFFKTALELAPDNFAVTMYTGLAYFQKNDVDNALKYLLKAEVLSPESGRTHGHLARAYYAKRDQANALKQLSLARQYKDSISPAYLKQLSEIIDPK